MHPTTTILAVLATLASIITASPTPIQYSRSLTPCFNHIFSGTINIAPPAGPPIPIAGGVRVITPITGGTIRGPLINATITAGIACPSSTNATLNNDVQIILYGETEDNIPFLLRESGIGPSDKQFTRIVSEIGNPYKKLTEKYILASIQPNKERTSVSVEGFEVKDCGTHGLGSRGDGRGGKP